MTTLDNLHKKRLFLFDIDGTLALGNHLYEGSARLLSYINAIGGRAYFITNNSTMSNADYVQKFQTFFHLDTVEDQFVTSGYLTKRFLLQHHQKDKIFVFGTSSFVAELKKAGLNIVETYEQQIACAVVAFDNELTYQKLIQICKLFSCAEVPFYGTNPDLCCPVDFGFVPDCGAICNMITSATQKQPVYLGKPSEQVVKLCLERSGFSPEETLVVGDRLYTDIACGINAGVDSCVVFTGEASREDLEHTSYPPTYAFDNIQKLYEACKQ